MTEQMPALQVGLCAACHWMQKMESDRGSLFYLCQRSVTDPAFPKYPRLPVLRCHGYDPLNEESGKSSQNPKP
jgi:hypothetical protein